MVTLEAQAPGWLSRNAIIRADGEEVTRLHVTPWKGRGSFTLGGEEFVIEPRGFLTIGGELKRGSTIIARGEQPSFWRRNFVLTSAGHRFTLESRSLHGRKYCLLVGTRELGTVTREGLTGRTIRADFPEEVPLVLRVFLIYLVLCQAKRDAAAGKAGN